MNNKESTLILDKNEGYFIVQLKKDELNIIRNIVENHWLMQLNEHHTELGNLFKKNTILNYHKESKRLNHKTLWPKRARVLPEENVDTIKKLSFFNQLQSIFGSLEITDELKVGHGIMVWRLVRPFTEEDITSMHSDKWFWDLKKTNANYTIPPKKKWVRCWISLWCHKSYGFRVVPYSQNKEYKYKSEYKDGNTKPIFNEKWYNLKPITLDSTPGNSIIFNHNLLHGGCLNKHSYTRISLEFGMFVN